jgi:bifunctional UDP-N-acetylglucosamine pyrophosphorylase/glucosamine-1-phosphate N-acetyltransferase
MYSPKDISALAKEEEFNIVSGFRHEHPEKYGVFLTDGEFLSDVVEKPKSFVSNLINTGLAKFTPEIFDAIDKVGLSSRGEYELTDAIRTLAKQKRVKVKTIEDYWFDFGNPADIIRVSKFLEKK